MADSDVGIKLVAEDASFKTAMANANQLIKQMAQEAKEAASGIGDLGSKQEAYSRQLDAQKQKLELLNKAHDDATNKLKSLADAMQKAKDAGDADAVSKAADAYTRQATEVSKLETQMSSCRTAINQITTEMQSSTKAAEENSTAAEKLSQVWDKIKTGFAAVGTACAALGAAVVAAGKEIVDLANQTAEAGDHIDKMSQKIGISAEAYQEWAYVCERSGASVDNLQMGMKTLSTVIADAGNGSESAAEKLEAVGLSIEDLNGKSQEEQLSIVVEALQNMEAGSERTAAATDLLGRSATDLGAVLNMTADETQQLVDEAHEYGMIMSDEAVAASAAFEDALTRMNGAISGVKNAMVSEFLPGLTTIMDGISDLVAGVDGADEKIEQGIDQVMAAFEKILPMISDILMRIVQTVAEHGPEIISSLVDQIIDNLPQLLEAGTQIIVALAKALIEALPKLLEAIPEIIRSIIEGFTSVDFGEIGQHIWEGVTAVFAGIGEFFAGVVTAIQGAFEGVGNWFSETFQSARQGVETVFQDVGNWFGDRWRDIQTAMEPVSNWFSEQFQAARDYVNKAFEDVGNWFEDRRKDVEGAWESVDSWMSDKFGSAWDAIKKAFDPFVGYFETAWKNVQEIFSVVESVLKGDFEAAWNGIKSIWDNVKSYFQRVWDDITGVFSNAFNAFKEIGGNIIEGIKKGISDMWNGFTNWIGDKWNSVINGAKSIFGISSPSKVMAQMGKYVVQGFALGMENNAGLIDRAADRVFGDVSNLAFVANGSASASGGVVTAGGSSGAAQAAAQPIYLQIDGKTFARIATPYIDMQQGRNWSRQVALGVSV